MIALFRYGVQCLQRHKTTIPADLESNKIEEYKSGYPQYTALLSAHNPWMICRRFDKLRARIVLLKQDKLSVLEQRLERIDQEETSLLFLGKSRCDRNEDRLSTLSEIEAALADYDQFVGTSSRMLHLQPANGRDIASLRNWVKGTGCLAREETAYLAYRSDLASLAPVVDNTILQFETWVEEKLAKYWQGFRKSRYNDRSTNPNVYIYQGPLVHRTAKAILICLITLLLMMPIIMCNLVTTIAVRILIILICTVLYLLILSWLTKSRTMELTLAGATYVTVLVVFISGTTSKQD
ncbi:hypothetical protein B5807_03238 [Epicoccum nigrum]|uniref:DUF6594 domain-containing protein n=1 Tax=Epicoccum nigrum TaxID=105696 RepID=A0A1Y2M8R7_EPING|nr:hypothetical protein B5807_03238 [Epicoccum nigrum]